LSSSGFCHRIPQFFQATHKIKMKLTLIRKFFLTGLIGVVVVWFIVAANKPDLLKFQNIVEASFRTVEHIDADGYAALDSEQIVVFDVRETDEFAVSHLAGALQIDPSITPETFAREFKDTVNGKTVVFYCSVGWRSSDLAQRVDSVLKQQGVVASYNLIGGLFQWHNEERPLLSETGGNTQAIHPYNKYWGRAIDDQSAIQYSPLVKAQ